MVYCAHAWPAFMRRRDCETLAAYQMMRYFDCVRLLTTNWRKRKFLSRKTFCDSPRSPATLPGPRGACCIQSRNIIHRFWIFVCVSGAFIFIQLFSETSAACAQGACEIVLSGRINIPEMFEKTRLPFLSRRIHFLSRRARF